MSTKLFFVFLLCFFVLMQIAESKSRATRNYGAQETASFISSPAQAAHGYVYAGTNEAKDNKIVAYRREAHGYLKEIARHSTKGLGFHGAVNDPLGSQASLIRSPDSKHLLIVNGGSNSISVFRHGLHGGLHLTSVTSSHPAANSSIPTSLTAHGSVVYVLNNGALATPAGVSSISGFRADWSTGSLTYVQGSTRSFPGNYGQVAFTPDGKFLILPGKGANTFITFAIDANGMPAADGTTSSITAGRTPFSLVFDNHGNAVVSLAFGGVGAYSIDSQGRMTTIQELNTSSAASCWIVRHDKSHFFYVVNAGKGSISAFRLAAAGGFSRLQGRTMTSANVSDDDTFIFPVGSVPLDATVTDDNQFVYVLLGGRGTIAAFAIHHPGGLLQSRGEFDLLRPGYNGINGIVAF